MKGNKALLKRRSEMEIDGKIKEVIEAEKLAPVSEDFVIKELEAKMEEERDFIEVIRHIKCVPYCLNGNYK